MISIKSKRELDLMKESAKIAIEALLQMEEAVKPGITTLELDKIAENIIKKYNAIPSFLGYKSSYSGTMDFPACICASINDEVVHGLPSNRILNEGDIISVDIGVFLNGFHSDAARTFSVGKISEKAQRLIDVTKQSFFEGMKQAVSGNRIVDISTAIQEYVETNNFTIVRDYVGHGIGREMHEAPQIPNYKTREKGPRLQPGMTLAVEPMVNEGTYKVKLLPNKWTVSTEDGSLSAHYENTIIITEGEPEIITL